MNKRGFTLIEVLISLSILLIVGSTFFSITNNSIRINSKNDKYIQEMNVAQSVIEGIRDDIKSGKEPYDNINYSLKEDYIVSIEDIKKEEVKKLYLYTFAVKVKNKYETNREVVLKTQVLGVND